MKFFVLVLLLSCLNQAASLAQGTVYTSNRFRVDTLYDLVNNPGLATNIKDKINAQLHRNGLLYDSKDSGSVHVFKVRARLKEFVIDPVYIRNESGGQEQEGFEGHLILDLMAYTSDSSLIDSITIDTRKLEGLNVPGLGIKLFRPVYVDKKETENALKKHVSRALAYLIPSRYILDFMVVRGDFFNRSSKELLLLRPEGVLLEKGTSVHFYSFTKSDKLRYLGKGEIDTKLIKDYLLPLKFKRSEVRDQITSILSEQKAVIASLIER